MSGSPSPTVVVTGLNGYIATHIAVLFLSKGWKVRGTARSADKVNHLKSQPVFKEWVEKGKLEIAVLEDLTDRDGYKSLLEGVEGVAHVAAPLGSSASSWEGFKTPTVKGVTTLLEVAKDSTTIKSIAVMSSAAAALDPMKLAGAKETFAEDSWFPYDDAFCANLDPKEPFTPGLWYCGAKKFAEQAAFELVETHKPRWSLATLCPPMNYGPLIQAASPQDLNNVGAAGGSVRDFISLIEGKDKALPPQRSPAFIDIRDDASAFYNAIAGHKSGRYFLCGPDYSFQQFVNVFRKLRPDLDAYFPLGDPTLPDPKPEDSFHISNVKSIQDLGVKYHSLEETLKDSLDYFEQIGVFKIPPGSWKV
ncbi:hypothetical protein IAR55_002312 [Kwoniella newhampshirensis]|uniref:NAD-dependent epimerase/dehydratase domain-containing protein n=1 Tax=Kwoniella newhampshirensis TaxID=1651941 RepID=A0AAW0Z0W4_9TREE